MREIVTHPDPVLKQKCRPLTEDEIKSGEFDTLTGKKSLRELVDEMTRIMRTTRPGGVGLAAPQAGEGIRLFIAELPGRRTDPLICINPELSEPRGSTEESEGCLSLPGVKVSVKRPQMIKLKAKNLQGVEFELDANGLLARVIQHEFDHLDGVMILTKGPSGSKKNKEALDEMERVYARWQERLKKKEEAKKPD